MKPAVTEPRYARTPHLVGLVAEAERLAQALAGAPAGDVHEALRADAAVASVRLDGSPLEGPPDLSSLPDGADAVPTTDGDDDLGGGVAAATTANRGLGGSWFDAMSAFPDEHANHVMALEYLGVRAATDPDDVAEQLLTQPDAALTTLHRRLTRGLLERDRAGRPRTTEQAVHDASTGRIIYYAPDPAEIAPRLALLGTWLATTGAREHAIVVSGVVHLDLLHLHPFEAANGRLARAAARLVLRARGLDPHGLAVPELALADDPIGYYEDVAATRRRRDLTIWLERWGEAVAAGLRRSARALDLLDPDVPARARRFVDDRRGAPFTIADYRAEVTVGPEDARADLEALLDAGLVARQLGSRGLRFTIG